MFALFKEKKQKKQTKREKRSRIFVYKTMIMTKRNTLKKKANETILTYKYLEVSTNLTKESNS